MLQIGRALWERSNGFGLAMDDDDIIWSAPPGAASLDWETVHVWAMSLQVPGEEMNRLAKMLVPSERRRAQSFHFDRDRNRFVVGRGLVRTLLAHYLHTQPEAIWLEYSPNGKPLLAGRFARSGLQFNLAHCEDLALLAVARGRVVGIDLERIRVIDDAQETAAWFCSPRENYEFQSLPPDERAPAFYRLWTRKETWLKAIGQGIGQSLEKVEVSFLPGEPARFVRLPDEVGTPASGWNLQELTPATGFVAALTVPGEAARLFCWKYKKKEEEFAYASS
jgi:4'-phosphopantetheinyl transferase